MILSLFPNGLERYLIGGLLIGWLAGADGIKSLSPLYIDLFKPVLSLFLLEMGLLTAGKLSGLRKSGVFLVAMALLMPLLFAAIGLGVAMLMGLSVGGAMLLATLCASASYIAAPAAMRIAVPEANPAISLAASLGVTFPFNLLLGIPLYLWWAQAMAGA